MRGTQQDKIIIFCYNYIMAKLEEVLEKLPQEYRIPLFEAFTIIREEKIELIAKEEILKIWNTLKEISEGNKKAEERLTRLEASVAELVEAQKRTEQRLAVLEEKMAELAEAQKKTEQRVNELAEAQKRTEQRVNELAEAQKRTEQRVNELAETQKKTEKEIQKLTGTVSNLQKSVGGLSHGFGHILEDKAILKLPEILKKKFRITLDGELKKGFLENKNGIEEEVNIFGFGKKNGKRIFILGEGKARFGEKDLKEFEKKISRFETIYANIFPIVITYVFSKARFEEKLKEKGIFYLLSYDLERV